MRGSALSSASSIWSALTPSATARFFSCDSFNRLSSFFSSPSCADASLGSTPPPPSPSDGTIACSSLSAIIPVSAAKASSASAASSSSSRVAPAASARLRSVETLSFASSAIEAARRALAAIDSNAASIMPEFIASITSRSEVSYTELYRSMHLPSSASSTATVAL